MIILIKDMIEKKPDSTLDEIQTSLNLPIQKSQIANLLTKLGYTYKKKRYILITGLEQML